jgi:hypothetical protein
VGLLDMNGEGKAGFEMGPGVETDFALFDRNQAGVIRANAELARGRARYLARSRCCPSRSGEAGPDTKSSTRWRS